LLAFELEGYRRFSEKTRLEVDGPVTAIVGPNEAGKTSLLVALTRLDDDAPIDRSDQSRHGQVADEQVVLAALYAVESDDREALAGLYGAEDLRRSRLFLVEKLGSGERRTKLLDGLERDLRPRTNALRRLRSLLRSPPWDPDDYIRDSDDADTHPLDPKRLDPAVAALESTNRTLSGTQRELLHDLGNALQELSGRAKAVGEIIVSTYEHESLEHPNATARSRLEGRLPHFLLFGEAQRDLRNDYDLTEVEGDSSPQLADDPPVALDNLARLGDLDLPRLRDAITLDDTATARQMLINANEQLGVAFAAWSQERISAEFDHIGSHVLRIHVRDESGTLSNLAERSDGVKIFVSLLALAARSSQDRPLIVLIDELERHLHYDAQADVVQVLTRQDVHKQVIYTTHSAGCLPEDLGSGVRLVGHGADHQGSSVQNRFWTDAGGFSPLLLGMGASTLAFVPVRHAVLTEGGSDLVLLPTLIREATGEKSLGFQVAPASSEAPASHIAGLDREALRVVWVVDGDEAGRSIRTRLRRAKIPTERIKFVAGEASPKVMEDLLQPAVFVRAVNLELERSGQTPRIGEADLPKVNRPDALKKWCARKRIPMPTRVAIANRVLDISRGPEADAPQRLLASDGATRLRRLHADISEQFGA
jgi:predicted ATP-dependent endonuclease of OLD family